MTSSFVLPKIQNEDVLNQIKMYATRKAALEPTKTIMRLFDEIVEETQRKTYIGKIQIQHALMESCTSRNTFSVWLFVIKDVTNETLRVLATKANRCRFDLMYNYTHGGNWICGAIDFHGSEKSEDITAAILETENVFEMYSLNAMTKFTNQITM